MKTKDGDAKDDNAVFAKDLYRIAQEKNLIPETTYRMYEDYLKKQKVAKLKGEIKRIIKHK
jgi:hypothetical protein